MTFTQEEEDQIREICRQEIERAHGEEAAEELREVQSDTERRGE